MAAVLVVLRAAIVALAVSTLLGLAAMVLLAKLRLTPADEAREALIELVMLGAVVLVLTRGVRWVPAMPLRSLFHPVAGAGDLAAALRIGLAFMALEWVAIPFVQGNAPEFSVLPGAAEAVGTIAAATMEEVLFRGYLLGALLRSGRPWAAVLAPSAVFALLHLPNLPACGEALFQPGTLVPLLNWGVSGMVYATITVLSGRIWPAAALHALHNLMVTAAGGDGCGG